MKTVIALSGGMDSVTLLYDLLSQGHQVFPIFFDYGQKHKHKEWPLAEYHAAQNGLILRKTEAFFFYQIPSALTSDDVAIPTGHYESLEMKKNVVPGRNMLFATLMAIHACRVGASGIALAAHAGDYAVYADCREDFFNPLKETIRIATEGHVHRVLTPYLHIRKKEIVAIGKSLNVDYSKTWSCYQGGSKPCGKCGACVERMEVLGDV
jgi:7-cyano-7-deazaguanine synthase